MKCDIQNYKCKFYGKTFAKDILSFFLDSWDITLSVIKNVEILYSNFGVRVYKIKYGLLELIMLIFHTRNTKDIIIVISKHIKKNLKTNISLRRILLKLLK